MPTVCSFHEAPTIMVDGKAIAPRRYAALKARQGHVTQRWTGQALQRKGVDLTKAFCIPEGKLGRELRRFAGDLSASKGAKRVKEFKVPRLGELQSIAAC
jgi:hypothetical protein